MGASWLAVTALGALAACHKPAPGEDGLSLENAPAARVVDAAPAASPPLVIHARCQAAEAAFVVDQDVADPDLAIGDAIEGSGGVAVGLLHRTARGRVAAVALLGPDGKGPVRIVDLGPTLGDAPPPQLVLRGADLVAADYALPSDNRTPAGASGEARDLAFYLVSAAGTSSLLFSVPQQRDDSLAFDVAYAPASASAAQAGGMVVWDEASRAGHGVVRIARLAPGGGVDASRDLSPPESDVELPRIIPTANGYVALWIARHPDPTAPEDAALVEAPGEPRTYGWLESQVVDEHGVAAGPVRRLSPDGGHVSAFDARVLAGAPNPTLLVVAHDDGESIDGSGGELLRVRVVGDAVEPPVEFSNDGLGRGAPDLVEGKPLWLTWVGPHEQLRAMPLDDTGAPGGSPSAEVAMSDARPLLFLRGAEPGSRRALVAAPFDHTAAIRAFTCAM